MYRSLVSAWQDPRELVRGAAEPEGSFESAMERSTRLGLLERMMLTDQLTYLPDDLLAKVDRASMAVSLEVRVPLLDHRVLEFAATLAPSERIRHGSGKWLLRQVLARHLPVELFERPKMGFSVPIATWLNGALRPWAEELLGAERIERGGVLRAAPIREAWGRFRGGHDSLAFPLWTVLMIQAWQAHWLDRPRARTALRPPPVIERRGANGVSVLVTER
jgi:asparagine synthase (glutamine-hydrolysing)